MKKLIVIAMILMASVCYADMKENLFNETKTIDVTSLKPNDTGRIYGLTSLDTVDFIMKATTFFLDEGIVPISPWSLVNESYCVAFAEDSRVYALCIEGRIVALEEIK